MFLLRYYGISVDLNRLQEHSDIKITQYKHKASHPHSNYFPHMAFRAIFEACKRLKL